MDLMKWINNTQDRRKKYDYYLTLKTQELTNKKELVKRFIEITRGKCMDWEEIAQRYKEYTPEFVAEQLMNRIRSN